MNTPHPKLTKSWLLILVSLLLSLSATWAQTTSGGGSLQGTMRLEW